MPLIIETSDQGEIEHVVNAIFPNLSTNKKSELLKGLQKTSVGEFYLQLDDYLLYRQNAKLVALKPKNIDRDIVYFIFDFTDTGADAKKLIIKTRLNLLKNCKETCYPFCVICEIGGTKHIVLRYSLSLDCSRSNIGERVLLLPAERPPEDLSIFPARR